MCYSLQIPMHDLRHGTLRNNIMQNDNMHHKRNKCTNVDLISQCASFTRNVKACAISKLRQKSEVD